MWLRCGNIYHASLGLINEQKVSYAGTLGSIVDLTVLFNGSSRLPPEKMDESIGRRRKLIRRSVRESRTRFSLYVPAVSRRREDSRESRGSCVMSRKNPATFHRWIMHFRCPAHSRMSACIVAKYVISNSSCGTTLTSHFANRYK